MQRIIRFGLVASVLFGLMALMVWGTSLPQFALWKFMAITFPLIIFLVFMFGSQDSLQFLATSLLLLLPVLGVVIPPKRWDISVFDVMAVFILLFLVIRVFGRTWISDSPVPRHIWIPVATILPSVLFGIDAVWSFITFVHIMGFYVAYIVLNHFFSNSSTARNRAHLFLCASLIVVALFILLERATGINFSTATENLNAMDYTGSVVFRRAAGLFQDPQKAGQFIAVWMVYLTVVWSRRGFPRGATRILALAAIFICAAALLITVSRLAIAAGFGFSILAYFLLGRDHLLKKAFLVFVPLIGLGMMIVVASDTNILQKFLPQSVTARFTTTTASAQGRWDIWKESWSIFEDYPVVGIGPGNYQEYLMRKTPTLRKVKELGGFVPSQPENGYLKILYETGLVGTFGIILFASMTILRIQRALASGDDDERTRAWAVVAGLTVFLITFTTLFTVADARNALSVVFLLVFIPNNRIIFTHEGRR